MNALNHIGPFLICGDHGEYITPIDNFFERGIYALSNSNTPYAGRLPGFIFPYGAFRAIFNEPTSNLLLGISIILLAAISSYYFAQTTYYLTKNKISFIISFVFVNFIPYYWHWEWTLHPNSLACSILIFSLYFLFRFNEENKTFFLFLTGLGLTWVFMLRGFTFLYLPITGLFLIYHLIKVQLTFKKTIIALVIFTSPFIILEGAWIIRNYIVLKAFIPLQTLFVPGREDTSYEYGKNSPTKYSITKVRELINCWGGDNFWYFKNADLAWFLGREESKIEDVFPKDIFFEGFTKDSLLELKKDIMHSYKPEVVGLELDKTEKRIIERSLRLKKHFLKHKKSYYYFKAPINRLQNFLFRNPTQDWPSLSFDKMNYINKSLKVTSFLEYCIVLILLPLGILLSIRRGQKFSIMLALCSFALIMEFSTIINSGHFSYFHTGYIMTTLLIITVLPNYPITLNQESKTLTNA